MDNVASIRGYNLASLTDASIANLQEKARQSRIASLLMTSVANSGHPAGSLSSIDIYTLLWGVINATPENMDDVDRDRVVVSHGHTSPGVYSALASWGFFDIALPIAHFRQVGSPFQGHIHREVPGIDWGTGNLGQGLAAGVGFALAAKTRKSSSHTYVLMGDGEQPKGQLAEARRIASRFGLSNLTAIVDWNNIQISGTLDEVMPTNIRALWEADGWHVLECDGHDFLSLYATLKNAVTNDLPTVILCKTIMGKGVSFMENSPEYHGKTASLSLLSQAMNELAGDISLYDKAIEKRKTPCIHFERLDDYPILLNLGVPITYLGTDKKDNRGAFGKALSDVAVLNNNIQNKKSTKILAMDCDLACSVKLDGFSKVSPEYFLEMGIQEHATATIAGAASTAGVVSLWADFGVFGLDEVYNQQRLNDINHAKVKAILTHVGLDVGEDGSTHQCIDYVGLLSNTFTWKLIVPADPNQTDRATRWALAENNNVCIAMGRSVLPVLTKEDGSPFYGGDYTFKYGEIDQVRQGKDASILAMGHMVFSALAARDILVNRGYEVQILHCATPLGMSGEDLSRYIKGAPLVTCEDHHVNTGIGSIVANLLLNQRVGIPFTKIGVTHYGESGSSKDVFASMQMTPSDIADAVEKLICGKKA